MTEKQSKELLKRACEIITSLEGFIGYNDGDYYNSHLSKSVDNLFDEVDMLNFHPHEDPEVQNSIDEAMGFIQRLKTDPTFAAQWGYNDLGPEYDSAGFTEEDRIVEGQYMTYVANVKRSIDKATEEGILRDNDSEGYSYLSKEEFIKRLEVDPRFVEMGDPNWLFPGEPLHDDPDAEAQDYNTFGNNKI